MRRSHRTDPELTWLPALGYAGHKEAALLCARREGGVDQVLANPAVVEHLETVLRAAQMLGEGPG